MRKVTGIIVGVLCGFLVFGILAFINSSTRRVDDANYLLTVVSTVATLGGVAFALYGWYSSREIPNMVKQQVAENVKRIRADIEADLGKLQEATQKIVASYALDKPEQIDQKINLLKSAVEIYPAAYNGYVSLAYAYWYGKNDVVAANKCFRADLEYHPTNYQSMSDLAALYASQEEWLAALNWMGDALDCHPQSWSDFETDVRFAPLRQNRQKQFQKLINEAKDRTSQEQ